MKEETLELKALVGSRAHGVPREDSDWDYRFVYTLPTDELLWTQAMGLKLKDTQWFEGDVDNTGHEIGSFLKLALQSNPHALETMTSPQYDVMTETGRRLVDLFDDVWSSERVYRAFSGYAHNQMAKFTSQEEKRPLKFAVAMIRTLHMGIQLLKEGSMSLEIKEPNVRRYLQDVRDGHVSHGHIYTNVVEMRKEFEDVYNRIASKKQNEKKVREFLLDIRHSN